MNISNTLLFIYFYSFCFKISYFVFYASLIIYSIFAVQFICTYFSKTNTVFFIILFSCIQSCIQWFYCKSPWHISKYNQKSSKWRSKVRIRRTCTLWSKVLFKQIKNVVPKIVHRWLPTWKATKKCIKTYNKQVINHTWCH